MWPCIIDSCLKYPTVCSRYHSRILAVHEQSGNNVSMSESQRHHCLAGFASWVITSVFTRLILVAVIHTSVSLPAYADEPAAQALHRGNGSEPQSLDPHKSEGVPSANIQRDLYEGLISETADGDLEPGVAASWRISPDGLRYIFKLRRDARWSNGDPVTADDFVQSWRRIIDPKTGSYYSQTLVPINNAEEIIAGKLSPEKLAVTAKDATTLEVLLKAPTPYFLGLLTHSSTYPLHQPSLKRFGDKFTRPGNLVSNGAYILDEWVVQSHIRVRRNPQYWNNKNTRIEQVYFHPIDDISSELKRYRAGEIDITETVPIARLDWIRKNLGSELHISPYLGVYYLAFNLTRPPFRDNPKLRQALSMVVNREVLTDKILKTGDIAAYSWVPPGVANYAGVEYEWKTWPFSKRVKTAQRLFREAGYDEKHPLDVEIRFNTSENHKKIALVVASMWKQHLGVKTRLHNEEWKVFLANRKAKKVTQIFRSGWIADYNDAFSFAELLHSKHGVNDMGYNNPEYDRLLALSANEADMAKRRAILQQAERVLLDDYAFIPVYHYVSKHLVKPYVGGYQDNIMDHHYSRHLYIKPH